MSAATRRRRGECYVTRATSFNSARLWCAPTAAATFYKRHATRVYCCVPSPDHPEVREPLTCAAPSTNQYNYGLSYKWQSFTKNFSFVFKRHYNDKFGFVAVNKCSKTICLNPHIRKMFEYFDVYLDTYSLYVWSVITGKSIRLNLIAYMY